MRDQREFAGRYLLERNLGRGGFGEVWAARDQLQERRVAIKFLYGEVAESDPVWLSKFRQEARIAVRLRHPAIAAVDDFGEYEGQWYLVMEFLDGRDLADEIDAYPHGLRLTRVVSIAAQIAAALNAAAELGVVHRDLKPGNVMLLDDDQVKVCDFGLAHMSGASTAATLRGNMTGTPLYMAPEQWLAADVDQRTDLYALGGILYTLLLGRPPFSGPTLGDLMGQHLNAVPASLRTRRPDVPEHLDALVLALLAKSPAGRPADAAAVLRRLGLSVDDRDERPDTDDPIAMFNHGVAMEEAGRPQDARHWYERAAEAGYTGAMNNLGLLLREAGRLQEAERWLRRAAEAGHANAMFNLATDLDGSDRPEEAEHWFRRAADAGDTDAMYNLGVAMEEADRPQDAEAWYRRSAEGGDTDAMACLVRLLEKAGRFEEAERWHERATREP